MEKTPSKFDRALSYALSEVTRVGTPDKLPPAVQIVVVVHAAQGMIDNGGLQYFFETDFPGQPPYSLFVEAYRTIGADDEAQLLADAVKLFPFDSPHLFPKRRNEFLESFMDEGVHRPESPLEPFTDKLCGNENVWRLLEAYVERHAETFPT